MPRGGAPAEEEPGTSGAAGVGGRLARAPTLNPGLAALSVHPAMAAGRAALILDQVLAVGITLGTAAAAAAAWSRTESTAARLQPLAVVAAQTACALFLFAYPREYMRHRAWLGPLLRIGVACMPSTRRMGLGAALALERPAQEGAAGALLDLLRVMLGTRVIAAFCAGLGAMLPPLSSLLCQSAMTFLLMNSPEACQTEMLRHPLTRSRMTAAAGLLDVSALPFAAFQPALPLLWRQLGGEALCQASVNTLMVTTGVVLPCLASALCWQPAEQHEQQCLQQRQLQEQEQEQQQERQRQQQARLVSEEWEEGRPRQRCQQCAARGGLAGAAAAADAALHRLCGGQLPAHARLATLWFCIAVTWLLCKQMAGAL